MITASNRWQDEIRKPPDGSQPTASGFGTVATASATPHLKGAWVDIITAGDWSGFTGDGLEIEIDFNNATTSATIIRILADIGIDTGSGYTPIIDNLNASFAGQWTNGGNGIPYRFPIRIPNGAKVGCRIQSNVASQTVYVGITVSGNPTHPGLVRCGTFVRTFGADTANTKGVTVTAGAASEGAWTAIATTADDLWFWDVGWDCNDAAFGTGALVIDLGTGPAASEVKIVTQLGQFSKLTTEGVGKNSYGRVYEVPSGTAMSTREQTQGGETTESHILYAVGGNHELADAATATGTVTVSGSPAANGKTVEIFAIDADGIVERIGSTTTGGGTGAFSLGCPDTTRSYFARYEDGTDVGSSLLGTPGTDALNIDIGGGGGGGETVPPVQTVVSPSAGSAFGADYVSARDVPAVVDVIDASSAIAFVIVYVKFSDRAHRETVYAGTGSSAGFLTPYVSYSAITGDGSAGVGFRLSVRRDDGWPRPTGSDPISAEFTYKAVDALGNVLS